jgi:hypothetical protein
MSTSNYQASTYEDSLRADRRREAAFLLFLVMVLLEAFAVAYAAQGSLLGAGVTMIVGLGCFAMSVLLWRAAARLHW